MRKPIAMEINEHYEITLHQLGRLTLRKDGIEENFNVTEHPYTIKIGPEFRQRSGVIEIYVIDRLNKLSIHKMFLTEYDKCNELECIFCLSMWNHPECLPSIFKYI